MIIKKLKSKFFVLEALRDTAREKFDFYFY